MSKLPHATRVGLKGLGVPTLWMIEGSSDLHAFKSNATDDDVCPPGLVAASYGDTGLWAWFAPIHEIGVRDETGKCIAIMQITSRIPSS